MNETQKDKYRAIFPHTKTGLIYLNHAAVSPLSNKVTTRFTNYLEERNTGLIENFKEWMTVAEETRSLIAKLIHSKHADRITFMANTSEGISAVAEGLDWHAGDEIILNTMEFPANVQPFRILEKKGVRLVYLEPDQDGAIQPEAIEQAVTHRTRLITISAVQYLNGFRADLKAIGEICRKNDLIFVVDGIQALGAIEIDAEACHIDALATGGHKWLMAPMGIGFLYLSEKLERQLTPYKTGWLSVENPWELSNFDQNWLPVSKHLETGTFNIMGITGLHASLSNLLQTGISNINGEIEKLMNFALEFLSRHDSVTIHTPQNPAMRAGIAAFSTNGTESPDDVVLKLKEKQIIIAARKGLYRISPHYYNTTDEVETALSYIIDS